MNLDQLVPGIYNYCDRWCERCPMTAKCYVSRQEQQTRAEHRAAGRDPDDWAVVLDGVKKQFEQAGRLLREAAEEEEGRAFHWRDALGSARVAREGVVRSMAALQDACDWDTGLEDQVIPLLADLDCMRKQIEETFPGCQDFKRPGFDAE